MKLLSKFGINSVADSLDAAILFILGVSFVLYSIFYKVFSEIHITLPFLAFPIFIGEIILFLCIGLTFAKFLVIKKKFGKFYIWVTLFLFFIFSKALYGYMEFGPLALRHAAMFYYSLFGIIAYEAYNPKILKVNLLLILFFILSLLGIGTYYNFTYLILMFIFLVKSRNIFLRVLGLIVLVVFFPFDYLIFCCRTQLIGHIIGFVSIFILFILMIKIKLKYKLLLCLALVFAFMVIIVNSNDDPRIKSLISPKKFISAFKVWENIFEKEQVNYKPKNLPIVLYNPETKEDMPQLRVTKMAESIKNNFNKMKAAINTGMTYNLNEANKVFKFLESNFDEKKEAKNIEITYNLNEANKVFKFLERKNVKFTTDINFNHPVNEIVLKKEKTAVIFLPRDRKTKNEVVAFLQERGMIGTELVNDPGINLGLETRFGTAIFRLFVWRDMLRELIKYKPIFGFAFGKPLRSESIEATRMAYGEWNRIGWIAAHNSYLEVIYRSGAIGIVFFILLFMYLIREASAFVTNRLFIGILLIGIIFYWLGTAIVYVTFELPYSAISFWTIVGITFAYSHKRVLSK